MQALGLTATAHRATTGPLRRLAVAATLAVAGLGVLGALHVQGDDPWSVRAAEAQKEEPWHSAPLKDDPWH